ncbi:hypothetical protein B0J11DRAFT_538676 [Dendryphion nanum]|uniref:Zn(2)-C6 fungal-type domain-containing protein n=1 Tax=Dendryphion nanum TaxID=256645 RepID=A0A9P9DBF3_9PLEO|nr:hypothetical protein B0J11DRAFT_538676 [Dendryphion nanum]
MEDSEQSSVSRAPHARTTQACQRCRSLKTRCLPSAQVGTCQRCLSSKNDCNWAEVPRRVKRPRGPSRISQVERKIDGLVASLNSVSTGQPSPAPTPATNDIPERQSPQSIFRGKSVAPGSWLPIPASFAQTPTDTDGDQEPSGQFMEKLRMIHSFGDDTDLGRPPNNPFQSSLRNEALIEDQILNELLVTGEADKLLGEYRSMSEFCPFVPIAVNITARELSVTKPMLFFAVMTVASGKDHTRQMTLDKSYRVELANRTIIQPRRTLSLIQSTVVYLSWYHFVFSHKTQQIFSLLQLAIGMAMDIGLHQKVKRFPVELPGKPTPPPPSAEEQRERQRTFLGLYYISSGIAAGMIKPNLLKHSDYMTECCRNLKESHEFKSDAKIEQLIAIRRIDDQVNAAFYVEDAIDLPITDSRISMNLRFMSSQLEDWKREHHVNDVPQVLELSHSFTEMTLYAVGLRVAPASFQTNADYCQINAMLTCLEAGRRFFDTILNTPLSDYYYISMSEWMRLPLVVITMARTCIPSEAHSAIQWDVRAAQDRCRLDLYLESLCYRMQSLSTYDVNKQPHPDFWMAMRMIMELTRTWYCRKIQVKPNPSTQSCTNDLPTPSTTENSGSGDVQISGLAHMAHIPLANGPPAGNFSFPTTGSMNMGSMSGDMSGGHDPFEFMRESDFDMDQFLDMGIWGNESYEGMGFGQQSGSLEPDPTISIVRNYR